MLNTSVQCGIEGFELDVVEVFTGVVTGIVTGVVVGILAVAVVIGEVEDRVRGNPRSILCCGNERDKCKFAYKLR